MKNIKEHEALRSKLRGIKRNSSKPPILRSSSFGGFSVPSSSQQAAEYSATENKTIGICLFHLLASRNIMTSDVFRLLREAEGVRLVLFVPSYKKDFFVRNYGRENVVIHGIDERIVNTFAFKFFKWLSFCLIPTYTVFLRQWERLHRDPSLSGYLKYGVSRMVCRAGGYSRFVRAAARACDAWLSPHARLFPVFRRYRFDLLFATDVFSEIEPLFVQAARRRGVRTVGMVRSWDNTSTKGLLRAIPDRMIVNNEIIADEAVALHGVPREIIAITGLPQFDMAYRNFASDRAVFCRRLGIDISRKIIFFGPAGSFLSDTDWQLCELLKRAANDGTLPPSVHFLVSKHPGDPPDLNRFVPDAHFTVIGLGTPFAAGPKVSEMTVDDQRMLVECLYHSAIVMCISSTLGMDSLPFDKPQIMVEFDGWERKPYIESVARHHDEDHMRKYLATGAVRVVRTPEEWFRALRAYLENPALNRKNRALAAREQLFMLDGRSGKRVAECVLRALR